MQKRRGVSVTDNQAVVYDVLKQHGPLPDHALVPIAQHVEKVHQTSSGIRSRRAELVAAGLVRQSQVKITMPSGRKAKVWAV
jgi:hypothetical protein